MVLVVLCDKNVIQCTLFIRFIILFLAISLHIKSLAMLLQNAHMNKIFIFNS